METRGNLKPVLMSLIEEEEFRKKLISVLVDNFDEFLTVFKEKRKDCLIKKDGHPKRPPPFSRGKKSNLSQIKFSRKLDG